MGGEGSDIFSPERLTGSGHASLMDFLLSLMKLVSTAHKLFHRA